MGASLFVPMVDVNVEQSNPKFGVQALTNLTNAQFPILNSHPKETLVLGEPALSQEELRRVASSDENWELRIEH